MSNKPNGFKEFVLDQLNGLHDVTCRAVFGGYGLYQRDIFFGIIHKGRLYFKVSAATVAAYQSHGVKPFRPNKQQTLKTYYGVPVEVIEDAEQLSDWAERSVKRG
jgi:DNA transformation protein